MTYSPRRLLSRLWTGRPQARPVSGAALLPRRAAITIVGLGVLGTAGIAAGGQACTASRARARVARTFPFAPDEAHRIGLAALSSGAVPTELGALRLAALAGLAARGGAGGEARAVERAIRAEFTERRTLRLANWVVSETEARLLALHVLTMRASA
ncbi:hypothetical protein [Parvularcula dongshanensis]|uniref:Uncharacterized protein n=1 Tax=Parvularcula dongshanensis TaxID=1173995 RepID=A0A840I5F7_9PROT|nr:hypothetical protein [Parvularcula dongshanensis]MBB4660186.1 hypothetical protein [Parvularcula dongshanensis]